MINKKRMVCILYTYLSCSACTLGRTLHADANARSQIAMGGMKTSKDDSKKRVERRHRSENVFYMLKQHPNHTSIVADDQARLMECIAGVKVKQDLGRNKITKRKVESNLNDCKSSSKRLNLVKDKKSCLALETKRHTKDAKNPECTDFHDSNSRSNDSFIDLIKFFVMIYNRLEQKRKFLPMITSKSRKIRACEQVQANDRLLAYIIVKVIATEFCDHAIEAALKYILKLKDHSFGQEIVLITRTEHDKLLCQSIQICESFNTDFEAIEKKISQQLLECRDKMNAELVTGAFFKSYLEYKDTLRRIFYLNASCYGQKINPYVRKLLARAPELIFHVENRLYQRDSSISLHISFRSYIINECRLLSSVFESYDSYLESEYNLLCIENSENNGTSAEELERILFDSEFIRNQRIENLEDSIIMFRRYIRDSFDILPSTVFFVDDLPNRRILFSKALEYELEEEVSSYSKEYPFLLYILAFTQCCGSANVDKKVYTSNVCKLGDTSPINNELLFSIKDICSPSNLLTLQQVCHYFFAENMQSKNVTIYWVSDGLHEMKLDRKAALVVKKMSQREFIESIYNEIQRAIESE